MTFRYRITLLCLFSVTLTACGGAVVSTKDSAPSNSVPDSDAIALIAMSEQALKIAQEESYDVVLRQVDTDLNMTNFRFVDGALTQEIMVVVPASDAPIDQWRAEVNTISPLLSSAEPAINLQELKVGPGRVAQAIKAHWHNCTVRGITLYRENDQLTWTAFCNTPEGVVSGNLDNQTGAFQPSEAPPASIAITATPGP
jgi:hypothetical protein